SARSRSPSGEYSLHMSGRSSRWLSASTIIMFSVLFFQSVSAVASNGNRFSVAAPASAVYIKVRPGLPDTGDGQQVGARRCLSIDEVDGSEGDLMAFAESRRNGGGRRRLRAGRAAVLDGIGVPVALTDADGRLREANESWNRLAASLLDGRGAADSRADF